MTAWARFCRNRLALLGLVLVVVLALSAALAPWLAPLDPARQSLIEKRTRPGAKYLLGADEFGRDILSRVIYGSRVALLVGVLSMLIALVGGLLLGTLAGFIGGWLDAVLMRGVEILLAFPYLLLALAIVAMLGPGVLNTTIAVGIWGVPAVTRIVRGSVLALREAEYVGAARALGSPGGRSSWPTRSCSRPRCRFSGSACSRRRRRGASWCRPGAMCCSWRRTWRRCRAWPSCSPCSRSISSATACATRSIRGCAEASASATRLIQPLM